ncbi:glycoside hydrolase family 32 protein [Microbacterium saccharophilum]|uniref:beta-fructofuranosidase n=1 Tax=Microbacterium saccharophilum TaxID=1213358 RepID=A0A5C8HVL1_9MICO|nr:glycoside hydrolase family 32 protein [Microbacterium saccharophilum]TXK08942.1 glycoside hydrolase family 32 protein [Microbacterium saccharophilum]GEP48028.1 hypothetical protein MSA03_15360 [Microbacterium saccharophilum]
MRPLLHFTATSGWINDPHGITYREGEYHSFFQYVPGTTSWAPNCHWGHAVGPDLLSLRELAVAIAPGDGDGGIWTGSLVREDNGAARVFYTSTSQPNIGIGRIRIATPADDDWNTWNKGAFVADAPDGLDIIAYRDPFVRRDGDIWRMFVGAGLRDGTATALTYTSEDLDSWRYEGIALERSTTQTEPVWMGALWECPQIFALDGRSVMVSSVWDDDVLHYAGYAIGTENDGTFDATSWGRLTYGTSYYAPSLFVDASGRPCLLFWMREIGGAQDGWASAHSIPHALSIEDGRLHARPHEDLLRHRGTLSADATVPHPVADIEWEPAEGGQLDVLVGGDNALSIVRVGDEFTITVADVSTSVPGQDAVLRVIVDGPVLEVSTGVALFGARLDVTDAPLSARSTGGELRVYPLA